jgi:hypothetical protein
MLPPVQSFKPKAVRRRSVRRRLSAGSIKTGIRCVRPVLKAPLRVGGSSAAAPEAGPARC